jgi:hypothetical protein
MDKTLNSSLVLFGAAGLVAGLVSSLWRPAEIERSGMIRSCALPLPAPDPKTTYAPGARRPERKPPALSRNKS